MGVTAQSISQLSKEHWEVLLIDLLQYVKYKLIFSLLFRCIQSFHILGTDRT